MSELEHATMGLHDAINELEARLVSVLQPIGPSVVGGGLDKQQPSPPQAPLAELVQARCEHVEAAIRRLEGLRQRIES